MVLCRDEVLARDGGFTGPRDGEERGAGEIARRRGAHPCHVEHRGKDVGERGKDGGVVARLVPEDLPGFNAGTGYHCDDARTGIVPGESSKMLGASQIIVSMIRVQYNGK